MEFYSQLPFTSKRSEFQNILVGMGSCLRERGDDSQVQQEASVGDGLCLEVCWDLCNREATLAEGTARQHHVHGHSPWIWAPKHLRDTVVGSGGWELEETPWTDMPWVPWGLEQGVSTLERKRMSTGSRKGPTWSRDAEGKVACNFLSSWKPWQYFIGRSGYYYVHQFESD